MVEEFSEFDESHLAVFSSHFYYLTPECLAERVSGEVLNVFQHIFHLDFFENNIDSLNREHITIAAEKAFLVNIFYIQCPITLFEMLAHTDIDLYLAMLSGLLLIKGKALAEYLFPRKGEKVADAKPEERAAGNKKTHPISTILEQFMSQVEHCVPRKIIGGCV